MWALRIYLRIPLKCGLLHSTFTKYERIVVFLSLILVAKQGTDLRFVVEVNLKSLCPKLSRGLIL